MLMPMPLGAIREQLRLVRYYSADRPSTGWGRATDIALALAIGLALPATWLADRGYASRSEANQITGKLFQEPEGAMWATVKPTADGREAITRTRGDAVFAGAFLITSSVEQHGWPFASSQRRPVGTLNVALFAEGQSLTAGDLPAGSPVRTAIEAALLDAGYGRAGATIWDSRRSASVIDRRWPAWLANLIVWLLLLPIGAWVIVLLARLGWLFVEMPLRARQLKRRLENRCPHCDYDLRGSTFSERCPECGAVLLA